MSHVGFDENVYRIQNCVVGTHPHTRIFNHAFKVLRPDGVPAWL